LPAILDVMSKCPNLPPVVWKSDFHSTPQAFELLDGVVDVYVADFKFGNDHCAKRLSGIENYVAILQRNLKIASVQGRLIVRHLLMPGHVECCFRPVAEWLAENLPEVEFSLRDGYLPAWRADQFDDIGRDLSVDEIDAAQAMTRRIGLRVIE
jgi:putative pyruvate formate lyase activating enzyme